MLTCGANWELVGARVLHANSSHSCTVMVSAYSLDLKERIVYSYLQGETMRMVAETFKVSVGFVHRVVDLYRRYGQVTNPDVTPCRGRHILTTADEDYIRSLVRVWPSIYLDGIQQELHQQHGHQLIFIYFPICQMS